jgi:hypothetical protein
MVDRRPLTPIIEVPGEIDARTPGSTPFELHVQIEVWTLDISS